MEEEERKDISFESATGAGGGMCAGSVLSSSVDRARGAPAGLVVDDEIVEEYVGSAGKDEIISCILRAKDMGDGGRST